MREIKGNMMIIFKEERRLGNIKANHIFLPDRFLGTNSELPKKGR